MAPHPQRGGARRWAKMSCAGCILGVESGADGLASGLLAGVNPVAGVYAYLFGMAGAALVAGGTYMAA